jgi:hypothetical protein
VLLTVPYLQCGEKLQKQKKIDERSTPSQPESSLQLVLFQAPEHEKEIAET